MAKSKKEKYIKKVGITGIGDDYTVYEISIRERILGYLIGFFAGAAAAHIMFGNYFSSLIIGLIIGFFAIPILRTYLFNRQKKTILLQFRDLLDSLSNSFSAGKNTPDAFSDALNDMKLSYGDDAIISKEVSIIISGLHSNFTIEDMLKDMSLRCGLQDINSFADTFSVCNRLGGNLKKVVSETRDIISDKIEIEMEIQTTITSNKNEMNVMALMPFVIVLMMGLLGEESITANTPLNIIVKFFAIALFVVAYVIGRRITNIKL